VKKSKSDVPNQNHHYYLDGMSEAEIAKQRLAGGSLALDRKAAGLNQYELAQMLDVHQTLISRWELGYAVPTDDQRNRMYEVFDSRKGKI